MRRSFPPGWLALFVAFGLGVLGALADLPRSPAHEAQLFFADHALRDWWGLVDARWYGGVDVTLVPGVAGRLAALLAKMPGLGLERAWALLLAFTGAAFGLGVARLVAALRPRDEVRPESWLVVAAASGPLVWLALIPGGALPAVLALAFALNAAAFARTAEAPLALAACAMLAGGAVATHPVGAVALVLTSSVWLAGSSGTLRVPWPRLAPASSVVVGALLGGVAAWDALTATVALRAELTVPDWVAFVVGAVAASVALLAATRRRPVPALLATFAFFAALVAPTVPTQVSTLPLLAAALALSLVSLAAVDAAPPWLGLGVSALVFLVTAGALGFFRNVDTRARRGALLEVQWVLANVADGERYRFVTLGVGPEWIELSRRVRPGSVDGALEGDAPSWDRVSLNDDASRAEVGALLQNHDAAVRWVVTGVAGAEGLLTPLGFTPVGAWRGNVTLWERASTPPLPPTSAVRRRAPWRVGLLGPLLGVGSTVVLALALVQLKRRTPDA